jgi:hypothetical protein
MPEKRPLAPDSMKAAPLPIRNPYIMSFCKALVERKGEKHETNRL